MSQSLRSIGRRQQGFAHQRARDRVWVARAAQVLMDELEARFAPTPREVALWGQALVDWAKGGEPALMELEEYDRWKAKQGIVSTTGTGFSG